MIRYRTIADDEADQVRQLLLSAFPTADEADLVDRLRADGDLAVEFVAVDAGAIVGHIAFSRMAVEADGAPVAALGLAPLAVAPDRQRGGIGGRLIECGLAAANGRGTRIVFVLGDPEYYGRFGFSAAAAAPFASPYAGPHLMAQWLSSRQAPAAGRADYAPAFSAL